MQENLWNVEPRIKEAKCESLFVQFCDIDEHDPQNAAVIIAFLKPEEPQSVSPLVALFVPKKFHLVPIRDAFCGVLPFPDPRKDRVRCDDGTIMQLM